MRRLILRNFQSAGDIVMLTAAVRDLHRSYPGEFVTDVRTPFPDLWAHNPHITPLNEEDPGVTVIDCHYPLIDQSNATPCHFLHGFPAYLNDRLGLRIRVTDFKGDIVECLFVEFVLVEFVERFLVVVRTLELLVFFRLVEFKLSFVVFELELAWLEQFVELQQLFKPRCRVGSAWGD